MYELCIFYPIAGNTFIFKQEVHYFRFSFRSSLLEIDDF